MRSAVLYLTVLGCALAVPNGYYHQEYNYKTSASSYKNNELQHQTDDQGYYRKDGDLEGRARPRVDANSEHSEYVNPNLRNGEYNTGLVGGANGDLSSYGHMMANLNAHGSSHDLSEGLAHSDHISGSRGAYSDYSAGSNSYGSSSHSYGTSSNLRSVTSRLQQELERELQQKLQDNRAYSQHSQVGVSELERELRQNLTNRLNAELASKYGQQSVRGGLSYTISGGRLHSTANYDNQELQDLRRQMENSLLNQLRTQYSSRYESQNSHQSIYGYTSTTPRPVYYTHYPTPYRSTTTIGPYSADYIQHVRYTPVSNPESLTTIASKVQTEIDSRLNQLLNDVERRYFSSSSSYSLTNVDVVLERLRNELRNNVTYLLNEDIRRNYGAQIPKDGHMYTVGPNGETSGQYNYAIRDLENLRSQIERNLIEKLNRDFERNRSRWSQQSYSQSSSSGSNVYYGDYSTPRYTVYSTPRHDVYSTPRYDVYSTPHYNVYDSDVEHLSTRPAASHLATLISNGGSTNQNRHYNLAAGSAQSGYEISGARNSASISQLQRQLQQDLSRQLQSAISRGHYGSYSTSGSYNPQSYQLSLQQLSDELNRNLTRQLQEYSASSSYSTYGNFDQAQLASLRSQLQADLQRQLQQGLQQSYSSSSSYSASSSSSNANYRPVRGFDNYQIGQYRTGGSVATMQGEDCVGDDPLAHNSHRMKRSYPPYRSQPIGLSYSGGYGNNGNYGYGGHFRGTGRIHDHSYERHQPQQVDEVEDLGQQVDDSDLTQQLVDSSFERVQLGSQNQQQTEVGQQVDDSDLTQQVEDSGFGRVQLGSQNQQQIEVGQQVDDSDLTQQVEDSGFGRVQSGSHGQHQVELGQQVDDSDLTQQVEDSGFVRAELGSHGQQQNELGQQVDDSDLTQQEQKAGLARVQLGSHGQQQIELGQQVDDSDLTQQVEDSHFGRVPSGPYSQQQIELGQQVDDTDLTQQVENSRSVPHQPKVGQQVDKSDLNQQVDDYGFGIVRSPRQRQIELGHVDNSDSTQQIEDSGFGNLHLGSPQSQQQIEQGQQEDNSDLTQQLDSDFGQQEDLTPQVDINSNGKLDSGLQGQHIDHVQLKLSQQQVVIAHQLEEELSKQLKEAIHNDQHDTLSSRPSYHSSYEHLLNELESNLTKQFRYLSSGVSRYGSSNPYVISGNFNDQQIQKLREKIQQNLQKELQRSLRESYSYSTSWSSTTSNGHNRQFGRQFEFTGQTHEHNLDHLETGNFKDFNQKQAQIAQQLEDELSKQLKNAVRTTYNSNSYSDLRPTDSQVLYQNLFNELQRNLTKQLQIVGTNRNSYSYSYTFNEQQLNRLRTKLERDLKLQLQQEVTSISTHHPENKLDQQQTDQELESSDLNQQIEDDAFRSHRKPGEQIVNTDRTQQQIGQEQVDADLILQNEDNLNQQVEATGFETPQFGDQEQIVQPSEQDQVNQIQQTDESNNVPKRLQIGNHQKGDNSQITQEQLDLNQQLDKNYYIPQQIPSANLQVNNRPVTPRPIDSNNFLKREREELLNTDQYVSGNSNVNYNQRPNGLPTLNQIIQQQQLGTNEHNTELLSPIEPLSVPENDDLNQQQVDIGQQSIEDLTGQTNTDLIQQNQINENTNNGKSLTLGQNNLPAGQISGQLNPLTSNQNSNRQVPLGQTGGESIGITSQGQLFRTQPQTLTDAEKEADLLIQRLRASQRNRGDQPSFGQSFTYVPYNQRVTPSPVVQHGGYGSDGSQTFSVQPVQEVNSFYQQHDSFGVYLNQEQAQFAKHLETELSKQVEDAVSQNYYTEAYSNSGSPNPQQYQTSYQQLSVDLQRNLTKQLQNILSSTQPGSSIYNSFTNQQREKLLNQLQADLLRQLQQSLKVSYGLEGQNIGYGSGYSGVHSSSLFGSTRHGSRGSNVYSSNIPNVDNYGLGQHTSQLQYGQPEETVQNVETVSDIQPIEPQQAHVVQNVEPQIGYSYNPGVKGHGRRYDSQLYGSPQHQSQLTADDFQQPLTSVPHAPPVDIQPPPVGSGTLQAEAVSSSQGDLASPTEGIVNQDDLPWWKRFGNKVKQGAHSLKEKIVG